MEDILMQMIAKGDRDSFDKLYSLWSKRVMAYAYRALRSVEDAQDVVQDTFVQIFRSAPTYRSEGKFAPFILRIAGNFVRMRYRRARDAVSLSEQDEDSFSLPAALTDEPEGSIIDRIDLDRALDALPSRQRDALVLVSGGASYAEASALMGISPEAFAQLVLRGRRTLRSILVQDRDLSGHLERES